MKTPAPVAPRPPANAPRKGARAFLPAILSLLLAATSASAQTDALTLDSGTAVTVSGSLWDLTGAGNNINIGYATTATLDITPTGTLASAGTAFLGRNAGSSGTVTVSGNWNNTGPLYIGNAGAGALIIEQFGAVNSANTSSVGHAGTGTGSVTVRGYWNNAGNLIVGGTGKGTLDITPTGTLINSAFYAADYAGSEALINLDGGYWQSAAVYIGQRSTGAVNILNGGIMRTTGVLVLGNEATGSGTLNIVSGRLEVNATASTYTDIGAYGKGYLNIDTTGTAIFPHRLRVGYRANSYGEINVAGLLRIDNTSSSYHTDIGVSGTGYLNIAPSGTVIVGHRTWVGASAGSSGSIHIAPAGTLITNGLVFISNNASSNASVIVDGYWDHKSGNINLGYMGPGTITINETGTLMGAGPIRIGGTNNGPSAGDGTILVKGIFNNGANVLSIGFGGPAHMEIFNNGTVTGGDTYVGYTDYTSTGNASNSLILHSGARLFHNEDVFTVGHSAKGVLIVEEGAAILPDPTRSVLSGNFRLGTNPTGSGSANIAGLIDTPHNFIVGSNANSTSFLELKRTGTINIAGYYSQNARSTLTVEIDTNRIPDSLFPDLPSPFINIAGPATLSGTLIITGTGFNDIGYTGDGGGRASELSGAPILRAIGGISGDFSRVEIASAGATDLSNLPDFIRGGGLKVNEGGPVPTRYDIGYGLAWNSGVDDAHGTFTVEAGKTFDVDVQLSDRPGIAFASGWDGQSLLKRGPGTLILSIGNAYTGATTVEAGTLQFAGPAEITIGDLVNNSVIDIRGASLATTATTGPAFRTLRATSLAGTGTFRMAVDIAAGTSDHLIIDGDAIGSHRFLITGGGAMPVGDEPMPVLLSIGGVNDTTIDNEITINNAHHIDGAFDYGIFNYQVEVRGNQIVIVNTGLDPAVFAPISGVPGAQSALWFDQQDNLSRRLGELRAPRETGSGFDLWTRAHAASATIGGGSTKMRLSDVDFWGAELGADYTWMLDGDRVTLGLFAGIGNASQDFRSAAAGTATGESDLLGAGLYAAWLDDTGWFANATLAAARYENSFAATDGSLNRVTGDYDENGIGVTIEAGRRIPLNFLGDGWFVEPALQGARARLTRGDYFTRRENGEKYFSVHGSAANITRLRATLRAGRAWAIGTAGWLEIAARASALHERSSGGEITIASAAENRWRPNLDGDRGEAGLGLYWRPFATGQFYFDYEYAAGNNYEKPWSLSLGFRLSL